MVDISDIVNEKYIDELWEVIQSKNIQNIKKKSVEIIRNSYSLVSIMTQLINKVTLSNISDKKKGKIYIILNTVDSRLKEGGNEYTQLLYLLISMSSFF